MGFELESKAGEGERFSAMKRKLLETFGHRLFIIALGLAVGVRFLLAFSMSPSTDVFYYDVQAAQTLLIFQNPYVHYFTGIPSQYITPGAEHVFAYLPLTALYQVPFYFVGDVRVGFIMADTAIGVALYLLSRGRGITSFVYLFIPFTMVFSTVFLNNSIISNLFIAAFILMETKGRSNLGAVCFGLALSAVQFSWLLLPFVLIYYFRNGRWKEPVIAVAVALVIILPFFLASPSDFIYDVVNFQFVRPTLALVTRTGPLAYNLNPSLNGILLTLLNFTLPSSLRITLSIAFLPVFILGMRNLEGLLIRTTGYILAVLFILPNDFFWSYAELPFLLVLAYASLLVTNGRQSVWRSWHHRMAREHDSGLKASEDANEAAD